MDYEALLKALDFVVIVAIMGVTEGVKRMLREDLWRWIPVVPILLGIVAGLLLTPIGSGWQAFGKSVLLYAGGASIAYEFLRTTIFKSGAKTTVIQP